MANKPRDVKDAPIPNAVNHGSVQEHLKQDNFVSRLVEQGKELLAETNRPNVITIEQFRPYVGLFNVDKDRYKHDRDYRGHLERLHAQYIRELSINKYEPTIVILSRDDPKPVYYLQRYFTRIASDAVEGKGKRDTVPAAIAASASQTRDQMILAASITDLVNANRSPEQMDQFKRIRADSAWIDRMFAEHNKARSDNQEPGSTNSSSFPAEDAVAVSLLDDD